MKGLPSPFYLLLSVFIFLSGLGLLMVYSSSNVLGLIVYQDSFYFFKRQLLFAVLATFACIVGYLTDPDFYRRYAYWIYGGVFVLLLIVLVPGIGSSAGGAARWIALGPLHIQSGEMAKFALIAYLAMSLAKKGDKMRYFSVGIIPHLVVPGLVMALLLLEPDFGTTMMVAVVTFVMLFIGGARMAYLFGALFLMVPFVWHAITSSPYRMERVKAFFDPWAHRQDSGYQVVESLIALGSGQLTGRGLGAGTAKLLFLPAARTDFILAVLGEEFGFIGIMGVLLCFCLIAYAGCATAVKFKEPFYIFLSIGLTTVLVLQAIVNAFVVLGLLPTKGITLPFMSYGGSSLIMSAFMMGVLLKLSKLSEKTT